MPVAWSAGARTMAHRFGACTAITSGERTLAYDALARLAHGLAAHLIGRGISAGTRVAILLPNGTDVVWASYGVTIAGGAETPLNPAYTASELAWCLSLAQPAVIVTDQANAATAAGLGVPVLLVEDIEPAAPGAACPAVPGDAWGRIIFSSGSTGRPKAIVYTHTRRWIAHIMLKATLPFAPRPGSRLLAMTPFTHGAGLQSAAWLDHGGEVLLLPGVEETQVREALRSGSIEAIFAPPTVIAKLAEVLAGERFDGVRCLFTGTQTLTPGVYAQAKRMFGPCVRITYGKSENLNPITVLDPADTEALYRDEPAAEGACLGWPASGVEIRIHDDAGAPIDTGETGEIWLRSQHMYVGHIDQAGFHALEPGEWHRSGDLGRVDSRGRLWLMGRLADVVKTGGYKVYPQEIELVLSGMPSCGQLCVTALPSAYWGEVIVAAAEGVSNVEQWIADAQARVAELSRYKHPRAYVALDALPRTAQGKIARAAVREAILVDYVLEDGPYPRLVRRTPELRTT